MSGAKRKAVLIYGASEYGAVLRDLVSDLGLAFAGYVDDWNAGTGVIGGFAEMVRNCKADECDVVIAVGYKHLRARRELAQRIKAHGFGLPSLVHSRAYLSATARLSEGCVVMAGAIVDTSAALGELTVLWPGAIVNHHSILEGNTFMCPASTVCGNTRVGIDCFVGAGATVVDGIVVPAATFVKAGSVYSGARSVKASSVTPLRGAAESFRKE